MFFSLVNYSFNTENIGATLAVTENIDAWIKKGQNKLILSFF
jgi:hypothetical protein